MTAQEVLALRALAQRFPTVDAAVNEIAHLEGLLHLSKDTVYVVSNVHRDTEVRGGEVLTKWAYSTLSPKIP
jgi:fructose-1,6-bisphosphatase